MAKEFEYFFNGKDYLVKESEWGVKGSETEKILGDYVDVVNHIRENKNGLQYSKVTSGANEREKKSLTFLVSDLKI